MSSDVPEYSSALNFPPHLARIFQVIHSLTKQ